MADKHDEKKTKTDESPKTDSKAYDFPFFKEVLADLSALGSAGLLKLLAKGTFATLMKLLGEFGKKTGEKVSENSAEWITFKIFGPKTEDERRFNEAQVLLDANDRIVLGKRLAKLTSAQSDYYRLTVMQDTPEKIMKIIGMHARMSETEWKRQCKIMNYKLHESETLQHKFLTWLNTDVTTAGRDFDQWLDEDLRRQQAILADLERRLAEPELTLWQRFVNWRRTRSERNREWVFSFQLWPFRFGFGRRNTTNRNTGPTVIVTPPPTNTDPRRSLGV